MESCDLGMTCLYLPGSPSALTPVEWSIFGGWMIAGLALYGWARRHYGREMGDRLIKAAYDNQS